MTLVELCEPLFQYMCRLNRMARKGASTTAEDVRSQVKAILSDMKAKAGAAPGMPPQFDRIELPLIFFVDSMIRESALPFARQWRDIAQERNELAGDEKFYDLLEETLADRSEAATERLAVFYTCLGLGFTGWYQGQPEYLRKKMMEIFARLRGRLDADAAARLCPESYQNVNTADLIQPPGRSLVMIAIALVGLVVVLFATNAYLYRSSSSELRESLTEIIATRPKATEAKP
jgi:type IV/VI secretion system ImpK/VasF family protein